MAKMGERILGSSYCFQLAHSNGAFSDANYTMVWNGMDYPACVFPVTKVDTELDKKHERTTFFGTMDEIIHNNCTKPSN